MPPPDRPAAAPRKALIPDSVQDWLARLPMAPIAAATLCSGLFLNGYDSAMGQAVQCLLTSALLGLVLLSRMPSPRFWRAIWGPLVLIAAALVWLLIVAVLRGMIPAIFPDAPDAPDLFLPKFLSIVAGVWALLIGARFGWRGRHRQSVIDWLLALVSLHLLVGMLLKGVDHTGIWDSWTITRMGRFAGLIGNSNVTAAMCAAIMILGMASMIALSHEHGAGRWRGADMGRAALYLGALLLGMAGQLMTAARFPTLVALAALAVLALSQWRTARAKVRLLLSSIIPGVLIVAVVMFLYSDLLVQRIDGLGGETGLRVELWSRYAVLAAQNPIWGYGPGSFTAMNSFFLTDSPDSPAPWTINSAHNLIIQLLLLGGLPYALLLAGAAWRMGRDSLLYWPRAQWTVNQIGLVLAGGAIFACSMVDIVMDVPASAGITLFLTGMAWGTAAALRPASVPSK